MKPLVSILIPCHNAAPYVGAAIESVIAQTWQTTQIIVVNDGSTDGSDKVLKKYVAERVRVVTPDKPLRSAAKSRNLAYEHSTGDFIKFFDADDLMHPKMVEHQIAKLNDLESDVASSGWGRFYRDDLATFKQNPQSVWRDMDARDWLIEAFADARPMMQPGMFLIPRNLIERAGGWDENLSLIDDFEFFARVLSLAGNVRFTPDVPLMYRSGLECSLSGRKSDAAIESAFHSLTRGTGHLLSARDDNAARRACANVLQDFIYAYYPRAHHLSAQIEVRVNELGGSDLTPDGPPKFQMLRKLIGWKLARRIQHMATPRP
tara:strand:+ start:8989 stop:9945 length:957 start_codon:yes stop_codon:yes gene_type:complete